jgi:hypothetical protein
MQRLGTISLFDIGKLDSNRLKEEGWREAGDLLFNEWGRIHTSLWQNPNDELDYDYVEVSAGPATGHLEENYEVGEIIDYLQWLENSYSDRDVLKLGIIGLRLYGERCLNYEKLMLRGWRFSEMGSMHMPLSKKYGNITVLLIPTDRSYLYPEDEPFNEILLSNSDILLEARSEGPKFYYGDNAANMQEIKQCLVWLNEIVFKYRERVGFVQLCLGIVRYFRYKFEGRVRKKRMQKYLIWRGWTHTSKM